MTNVSPELSDLRRAASARRLALAEFGGHALRSFDLDSILQEACVHVARGLDVPIAKVLQVLPGGGELLLRAAVGLAPEVATPGETRVPGDGGSAAGFAIKTGHAVISDTKTEDRFEVSALVRRVGAVKTLNVLIQGEDGPFGVLEADSLVDRAFDEDDAAFLQNYANMMAAAVERQRAGALVRELAEERAVLLRELQHRVKNDLQVITSLLSMESRQTANEEVRNRLESVAARINALRLVHDRLYAGGRHADVDLGDYLGALCVERLRLHGLDDDGPISLALTLSEVTLDHDRAVAVGMIANEFITNSLKYAFPTGIGEIRLALAGGPAEDIVLSLADTGAGMSPDAAQGTGLRLISMLVNQLGAEASWAAGAGAHLTVTIPR